jgi:hypothetical protein
VDYLIDCACGHDLTRHGEAGCRANDSSCACMRTRLQALDGAIERARITAWAQYTRKPVDGTDKAVAASALDA